MNLLTRPVPGAWVPDIGARIDIGFESDQSLLVAFWSGVLEDGKDRQFFQCHALQFRVDRLALLTVEGRLPVDEQLVHLGVRPLHVVAAATALQRYRVAFEA